MIFTDDELKNLHILTKELNEELANDITEEDKERLASYIKLSGRKGSNRTQCLWFKRTTLCNADIANSCSQYRFKARVGICNRIVCWLRNGVLEINKLRLILGRMLHRLFKDWYAFRICIKRILS